MHYQGVVIAVASFLIIGIFHPVVIKGEYYFGTRVWPVFALSGIVSMALATWFEAVFWQAIFGVLSCTFFWSIKELFDQKKRVEKGWFPKNPNRHD